MNNNLLSSEMIREMLSLEEGDYGELSASNFEQICSERLARYGTVIRQVKVPNRGDGRSGKIDMVFQYNGESIPIEIDRCTVRGKSLFKVTNYNPQNAFCITRSPFKILQVHS